MASGESATVAAAGHRPGGIGPFLRSQMRNIAPFLTLIFLSAFFAFASPSFATLDNLGNILTQVSVTGVIAVGLTYVNIANVPLAGWAAILLSLLLCALLGLVNALGLTMIGIPSFIMTLAMMQI